ncbi:MAG: hypothetical protein RR671_02505 [Raoultibacter sp.]
MYKKYGRSNDRPALSPCPPAKIDVKGTTDKTPHGRIRTTFLISAAGIAILAAVIAAAVLFLPQENLPWFDQNAAEGPYAGKTEEEIKADLNRRVEEGMMNISIASRITFPSGTSAGTAHIENIAANPVDQKVVISLKDTDETLYESGAIAPGQHLDTIKLNRVLEAGSYDAIATFTGYNKETHEETGRSAAETILHVSS